MYTPVNPILLYKGKVALGSTLHGHVGMMCPFGLGKTIQTLSLFAIPSVSFKGTCEPRYEKTCFLHMRKQRRRSASR